MGLNQMGWSDRDFTVQLGENEGLDPGSITGAWLGTRALPELEGDYQITIRITGAITPEPSGIPFQFDLESGMEFTVDRELENEKDDKEKIPLTLIVVFIVIVIIVFIITVIRRDKHLKIQPEEDAEEEGRRQVYGRREVERRRFPRTAPPPPGRESASRYQRRTGPPAPRSERIPGRGFK
jgi:hypothetical protein